MNTGGCDAGAADVEKALENLDRLVEQGALDSRSRDTIRQALSRTSDEGGVPEVRRALIELAAQMGREGPPVRMEECPRHTPLIIRPKIEWTERRWMQIARSLKSLADRLDRAQPEQER